MNAKEERKMIWKARLDLYKAEARYRIALRERAVRRQGGVCIYCEEPFSEERPATCEHIVPTSRGGLDTPENCAASCFECNQTRDQTDHGAFLRFKQAQKEADESGGWEDDEESEPKEPTPEAVEAGRELMGRLVPVQGAVSLGASRDGVLDEDLFEMYADRAVKGDEAVTNPEMLATMAALGCDSRHAHIFQTAVHAAVGGCWCDKCEAEEERLRQETAGMDSYQAIEHVLHQILYTRRGRLSALIHRVRDVGLHNAWVSWWRMRRLVWQFRKMEADHD